MKIPMEKNDEFKNRYLFAKVKDIKCPRCYENAKMNIKDFKMNIYGCKNNHLINDIVFDEFDNLQKIDMSKIICGRCKINKENVKQDIHYCINCRMNVCEKCLLMHKNHYITFIENKNYICPNHREFYTRYCKYCKLNLCLLCQSNHNSHDTISLIPDLNKIKSNLKELKENIIKFNSNIEKIRKKLKKVAKNIEIYYNIYFNICYQYEKKKIINYELYNNLNELKNNNNMINDMKKVDNEFNINNKFRAILDIYN